MKIQIFKDATGLAALVRGPELIAVVGENPFTERPEVHIVAVGPDSAVAACCSVWSRPTPALAGERVGCIGHFFAADEPSGAAVLLAAENELRTAGLTRAIGPINGSTWRKYRFVTWSSGEPPLLMEPSNPSSWPHYWERQGFAPLAGYHSTFFDDLSAGDDRVARAESRLAQNGISIRPLDPKRYEEELGRIFSVSRQSFVSNFLYTPISEPDFIDLYRPVKSFADPRFCLLAEREGIPVGFIFSVPDLNQAARGQTPDTLIVKTLAALPDRQCAGLGAALVERIRRPAIDAGMRRIAHALMFDQNGSANIGKGRARIFRRYTLYSKSIAP